MKLKHLNLIALIALGINLGYAQSLPVKQEQSLRIPDGLKIDGKATEWNGQLQAYNKTTDLFYTIANDDENLYLIVQAVKPRIIEKIIRAGITLTVNNAGKKSYKAKESACITFPIINESFTHGILIKAGDKANWSGLNRPNWPIAEVLTRTDSTVDMANKAFKEYAKTIGVQADGKTDTISVYNDKGIKVTAVFDYKGVYTYEVAPPLKFFGLSINDVQKFNYSIKLNSSDIGSVVVDRVTHESMSADPDLEVATEFWAEYTLAKKQQVN